MAEFSGIDIAYYSYGTCVGKEACKAKTTELGGYMKLGILILEGPYQHQASDSAYHFAEAALKKGHEIAGIFFYDDGVQNTTNLMTPPQDDRHISKRWSELVQKHGIDTIVCIAAAKRRGITDGNLIPGARISGLGQLTELGINADRLITFGD